MVNFNVPLMYASILTEASIKNYTNFFKNRYLKHAETIYTVSSLVSFRRQIQFNTSYFGKARKTFAKTLPY